VETPLLYITQSSREYQASKSRELPRDIRSGGGVDGHIRPLTLGFHSPGTPYSSWDPGLLHMDCFCFCFCFSFVFVLGDHLLQGWSLMGSGKPKNKVAFGVPVALLLASKEEAKVVGV
jgi:hypothetical protein